MGANARDMNLPLKLVTFVATACALLSVAIGVRNALVYPNGSFDFQYDSARLLIDHVNVYDESLSPTGIAAQCGYEQFYGSLEANQFPSLLLLLAPFVLLPPYSANVLWALCNLVFTAVSLALIRELFCKRMPLYQYWIVCCSMLAGLAWRNNIGNGQHTIFALSFWLLSLYFTVNNHRNLSSIALAVSFFKYTLTLPFTFYFIYKRRWREVLIALGIHVVLTVFSAWWLCDSIVNMIIKPLVVSSQLESQGYIDLPSIFSYHSIGTFMGAAVLVGAFVVCLFLSREGSRQLVHKQTALFEGPVDQHLMALLTLVSLVFVYHRTYDYFVLIVPLVLMWDVYVERGRMRRDWFCFLAGVAIFVYPNYVERFFYANSLQFLGSVSVICRFVYAAAFYLYILFVLDNMTRDLKEASDA